MTFNPNQPRNPAGSPHGGEWASGKSAGGVSRPTDGDLKRKGKADIHSEAFKKWFGDWENDPENASKVVDEDGKPLIVYHGTNHQFDEFGASHNAHTEALGFDTYFFTPNKAVASTYAAGEKGQLLGAYMNLRNPLEIDAKGGEWHEALGEAVDNIRTYRTEFERQHLEKLSALFDKYRYELDIGDDEAYKAEALPLVRKMDEHILANRALYANAKRKPFGYDGIIIKNALDMTANEVRDDLTGETSHNPYSTQYVAFYPNQIKAVNNRGTFDPKSNNIRV